MTNTAPNGIRYGTIYLNHLDPDVADDLWMNGENLSEKYAYEEIKTKIESDADDVEEEVRIALAELDPNWHYTEALFDYECDKAFQKLGFDDRDDYVETRIQQECEDLQIEEPTIAGTCEGVKYEISHLGGSALLWILESPHVGRFNLCSPCCPNACSLESPNEGGYDGYTVPESWLCKEN